MNCAPRRHDVTHIKPPVALSVRPLSHFGTVNRHIAYLIGASGWLKGLTLSADWWHIDMRESCRPWARNSLSRIIFRAWLLVVFLRFLASLDQLFLSSIRRKLAGAIFEGLDYEAIYILESSMFGAEIWQADCHGQRHLVGAG